MTILNHHVLMLNRSWVALSTCTVRSAFGKLFEERALFLDQDFNLYDLEAWLALSPAEGMPVLRTSRVSIRVPEILVLKSDVFPRRKTMQFSRRNLLRRDKLTCQYCGKKSASQDMTIDHVIPRKSGGKSTWTNCVISCFGCNHKKADKTIEEAGMALLSRPEMKNLYPHDPQKWTSPYVPAWSPVFKVTKKQVKNSWHHFLSDAVLESME